MESCKFSQAASLAEHYLLPDSTRTDLLLLLGRARSAEFLYRDAINSLQKARQIDSTNIIVLNELANVYRQSGDPARAIAAYRSICSLIPGERFTC